MWIQGTMIGASTSSILKLHITLRFIRTHASRHSIWTMESNLRQSPSMRDVTWTQILRFLKNIQYATKCAQQNISKFNEDMASYATIKRTPCSIQFGDLAFLSANIFLEDFLGQAPKLLPEFIGPYEVGDKINKVTFLIDLQTVLLRRGVHSAFYSSFFTTV